jgi:hypothetical protein
MIRVLKLQKAVIAFLIGVLALIAYKIMSVKEMDSSIYFLEGAGLFFMLGAVMFIYPILFSKKDKEGCVELDQEEVAAEERDHSEG